MENTESRNAPSCAKCGADLGMSGGFGAYIACDACGARPLCGHYLRLGRTASGKTSFFEAAAMPAGRAGLAARQRQTPYYRQFERRGPK